MFFNKDKITKNDLNTDSYKDNKNCCVEIEVEFNNVPPRIIIDSNFKTSLKDEYLLDKQGNLHVLKRFSLKKSDVFIKAFHPTNEGANNLLQLKNTELKKIIKTLKLDDEDINLSINSNMRRKIWEHYEKIQNGLIFDDSLIPISSDDLKKIYQEIKLYFPIYELFSVDRANIDVDNEVQDPLQIAIKSVFHKKEVVDACNIISDEVKKEINNVTLGTMKTFHELSSDFVLNLHSNLLDIMELKWTDVFKKVGLIDDNMVPLNQHGSGVRRLCILSFLIYSVERRAEDVSYNRSGERPPVIYAIEEPETSLHYDHQVKLIDALKNIDKNVNNLDRVIITTHSSTIVKNLDWQQLRIIQKVKDYSTVCNVQNSVLPYASLNEVNYLVFNDPSIEHFDELYGYINEMDLMKSFEAQPQVKKVLYIKQIKDKNDNLSTKNCHISICQKVRHQIHHPENTLNTRFTKDELSDSICLMRKFILNNIK